jgi:hypothetical protein
LLFEYAKVPVQLDKGDVLIVSVPLLDATSFNQALSNLKNVQSVGAVV